MQAGRSNCRFGRYGAVLGIALASCAVIALGLVPRRADAATNTPVTDLSSACPSALIAEDGFADVSPSSTHERAVDCVAWWRVASGSDWGGFLPANGSTRAASASFV